MGSLGTAQAASTASVSVGYVDFLYLVNQHLDTVQANAILKVEQDAAKNEVVGGGVDITADILKKISGK